MKLDSFDMTMNNPHAYLNNISKFLSIVMFANGRYQRVSIVGEFKGIFDYGRGILTTAVSVVEDYNTENLYNVLFVISSIDDGVWQAWTTPMEQNEALNLQKQIAKEVLEDLHILPAEEELNDRLKKYKMFGCNTG